MSGLHKKKLVYLFTLIGSMHTVAAHALPDPGAPAVALKHNCGSDPNCFTDATALLNWAWGTRDPDSSSPLLVNIDPGDYTMPSSTCSVQDPSLDADRGHITLRGSGRENTRLRPPSGSLATIDVHGCNNLAVEALTIDSTTGPGRGVFGVIWREGGSSVWSNVNVRAFGYGWYDTGVDFSGGACQDGPPGRHEWYGSSIRAVGDFFGFNIGYHSGCGDTWIYGGEVSATQPDVASFITLHAGLQANSATGSIHIYGSNVLVLATSAASASPGQVGLNAKAGGILHHHGGEIVVRHENPNVNQTVVSLGANGAGSRVHVLETSFGLQPAGTGNAQRVVQVNAGEVNSVFQWPAGTLAPTPGDSTGNKHLVSLDGFDSFVETDCALAGGCQGAGNIPHTMLYTAACTGTGPDQGPWFDTVTGNCRGL